MPPALLGVVALLIIGAVVYYFLRSKKPAELSAEDEKAALPPPKATPSEKSSTKPAVDKKPSEDSKAPAVDAKPAVASKPEATKDASPSSTQPAPTGVTAEQTVNATDASVSKNAAVSDDAAVGRGPSDDAKTASATAAVVAAADSAGEPQSTSTSTAAAVTARPRSIAPPGMKGDGRDVAALKRGLKSARGSWVQRLVGIFSGKKELDPELMTSMEELLLTGDVGGKTTETLLAQLKERLDKKDLSDENVVWSTLRQSALELIDLPAAPFGAGQKAGAPLVILVVGVNGVGKTTTIGKLAALYKSQGKKVVLAAGDTFRAAAVAQLDAWGKRVGVQVVKGKDLTKPGAVIFDAVQTAVKEGADVVLADTAGRLHTKTPLMEELRKLGDAAAKALPGCPHEILLVLDATTGQNAVVQVGEFKAALAVSGIVLTKLDGTAKGGVILSVCNEHKLPVRFIGVGEKVDDLREFNAAEFTEALFSTTKGEESEATG
jgi:fused signal recognition particle receptor